MLDLNKTKNLLFLAQNIIEWDLKQRLDNVV